MTPPPRAAVADVGEPATAPPMACAAQRRQGARAQRESGVGAIGEDGSMTTVRGTIRSTNAITADGHADNQSIARARDVEGLDRTGYDVVQTNRLSSTAAVRAVARSTEIQPHEASGPNCDAALKAYRQSIPDGWISLGITVDA